MAEQNLLQSKKKQIIFIFAAILVLIAAFAAYFINSASKKSDDTAGISIEDSGKSNVNNSPLNSDGENRVAATVEIEFDDCAVAVGASFNVTASVTPPDTDKALVWSSSDDNVLLVDDSGVVTVNGVGTAVLTATVGNVSDAVVIEGISDAASGSANDLPVYAVDDSGWVSIGNTDTGSYGNSGSSGSDGSSASSGGSAGSLNNTGGTGSGGGGAVTGGNAGNSGNSGDEGDNGGSQENVNSGGTDSTSGGNNNGGGNNSGSGDGGSGSDTGTGEGNTSDTIGSMLPGLGFSRIMSNVYVYEDEGSYCGEVVTQPNVAIIYIMQRSSAFDRAIGQVLELLVPGGAGQIWNNYVSADSDRTFTIDDRRIRIVMPSAGGHSQIVIYN